MSCSLNFGDDGAANIVGAFRTAPGETSHTHGAFAFARMRSRFRVKVLRLTTEMHSTFTDGELFHLAHSILHESDTLALRGNAIGASTNNVKDAVVAKGWRVDPRSAAAWSIGTAFSTGQAAAAGAVTVFAILGAGDILASVARADSVLVVFSACGGVLAATSGVFVTHDGGVRGDDTGTLVDDKRDGGARCTGDKKSIANG